ncbi:Cytosolic carboxypeptidase 6 [Aphelenchoides besseyi]|nr:Cytosolic carboxypeptidase 6 [Aphelenchoides besseyi]
MSQTPAAIVGNVQPANQQSPSGHLVFDATFESGNLGRVDELSIYEYDLFIRPDTCNPKYRVWFYFSVSNFLEGNDQRVVFNIVNFSKLRNLFDKGCAAPVYREFGSDEGTWNRISANRIYYYRSKPHGDRFILSFVHIFRNVKRCEFAYSIPYTFTRLQEYLKRIDAKHLNYFRRDPLCMSVQKRRVDLLTITQSENLHAAKQKIVFITGRVHPGEAPASHVIEGFIDFLTSDDPRARKLRSIFVFKIVPMLNPDGVQLGNYRCSLMGFDLNRQYQHPSLWAHPTISATKSLLLQFNTNPHMELVLCFDVHAHSQQTNSFLYGNLTAATSPRQSQRQLFIPYIMADLTDDYSLQHTQFNVDADKAGTNRRTMGELLDSSTTLCYTFEVSFFSYRPKGNATVKPIPYFESTYRLLGENLAIGILKYSEVLHDESLIQISRSFETFLSRRDRQQRLRKNQRQTQAILASHRLSRASSTDPKTRTR